MSAELAIWFAVVACADEKTVISKMLLDKRSA